MTPASPGGDESIHVDTFFGRFTLRRDRPGRVLLLFKGKEEPRTQTEVGRLWVRTELERSEALDRVLAASGLWHPRPVARVEAFLKGGRA